MTNKNFTITVAGNIEKEVTAPNNVADIVRFQELIQREYDRQHHIQLTDKLKKAESTLARALEKGVKGAEKDEKVAKVNIAKEAVKAFEDEVSQRTCKDMESLQKEYFKPTGNRLASAYTWAMFKTGGIFNITGFHDLWVLAKSYKSDYADSEEFTTERLKDFKALKESGRDVLAQVFNTTGGEGSIYKSHTTKTLSAWVANSFADAVYGKLVQSGTGISRTYLKEQEASRQLILVYLQFLGVIVEDSVKKTFKPESMETRKI